MIFTGWVLINFAVGPNVLWVDIRRRRLHNLACLGINLNYVKLYLECCHNSKYYLNKF